MDKKMLCFDILTEPHQKLSYAKADFHFTGHFIPDEGIGDIEIDNSGSQYFITGEYDENGDLNLEFKRNYEKYGDPIEQDYKITLLKKKRRLQRKTYLYDKWKRDTR